MSWGEKSFFTGFVSLSGDVLSCAGSPKSKCTLRLSGTDIVRASGGKELVHKLTVSTSLPLHMTKKVSFPMCATPYGMARVEEDGREGTEALEEDGASNIFAKKIIFFSKERSIGDGEEKSITIRL